VRELIDRRAECGVLDGLAEAVRAGESRVLVVHGEAGVGKTALLGHLADRASRCRVLRVVSVQSEMELAFAGLHQLCAPLLDRVGVLPGPQREALQTAFGMSDGPAPDPFRRPCPVPASAGALGRLPVGAGCGQTGSAPGPG
jgi:AAA ATPase domain